MVNRGRQTAAYIPNLRIGPLLSEAFLEMRDFDKEWRMKAVDGFNDK